MPDKADLIEILLCSNGTLMGDALSYVQYFGPTIVQAVIWGVSLKNRDPFIFMVSNMYTWLLYYVLVIIRDVIVETPRPFFVSECERSFAVPDAWWIVTTSFLTTMMLCSLIYRKRTVWRLITIFIVAIGLVLYIIAPLINGYMFTWQFIVNSVIAGFVTIVVNLVIYFWLIDLFVCLSEYQLFASMGFEMCFLKEWMERHPYYSKFAEPTPKKNISAKKRIRKSKQLLPHRRRSTPDQPLFINKKRDYLEGDNDNNDNIIIVLGKDDADDSEGQNVI